MTLADVLAAAVDEVKSLHVDLALNDLRLTTAPETFVWDIINRDDLRAKKKDEEVPVFAGAATKVPGTNIADVMLGITTRSRDAVWLYCIEEPYVANVTNLPEKTTVPAKERRYLQQSDYAVEIKPDGAADHSAKTLLFTIHPARKPSKSSRRS